METFHRSVEAISEYSGRLASWIIYIGIIILTVEVVLRYIFNSPTVWAHGYTQRIFGSYFVLIGAYTFIHEGHVRIDLIYAKVNQRMQAFLDITNCVFLLVWSGVLIPCGWEFFMKSYKMGEVDQMVLAHPIWWVKFMIPLGMALIFLQGIHVLMKRSFELLGRK